MDSCVYTLTGIRMHFTSDCDAVIGHMSCMGLIKHCRTFMFYNTKLQKKIH